MSLAENREDPPMQRRSCVRRSGRRLSTAKPKMSARHLFNFDELRYGGGGDEKEESEEKDNVDDCDHLPTSSFRSLRVLNEDVVQPGGGMTEHGHCDAEIFSVVLRGALRHTDSLSKTTERVVAGDVQFTSAGTGVRHSEMNSDDGRGGRRSAGGGDCLLFQVWILPDTLGLPPSYDHRHFAWLDRLSGGGGGGGDGDDDDDDDDEFSRPSLLLSETGEAGSIKIHQRARVWGYLLEPDNPWQRFDSPFGPSTSWVVAVSSWTLTEDERSARAGGGGGSVVVAQASDVVNGGADDGGGNSHADALERIGPGDTAFVENVASISIANDGGDERRYFLLLVMALGEQRKWAELTVEEKWQLFQETQRAKQRELAYALA